VGEIVGEFALFDEGNTSKTRTASVIATVPTILLVIMNYSIADLAMKHIEIYEKIEKIIHIRRAQNEKIIF
jgi:CRP-like cAMP-binding protein